MRHATLFTCFCLLLSACAALPGFGSSNTSSGSPQLTIMAAASLTEAFSEIEAVYENQRDVDVVYSFAGSQQLSHQILSGAPADVFASANQKQMDLVIEDGAIMPGSAHIFAHNQLVVIFPSRNPAGIKELADLARPGVSILLASEEVPVGRYTLTFLNNAANDAAFGETFRAGVMANIVSYENNVKSVLTKVVLDEADAGIVYHSDLTGPAVDQLGSIDIPDHLNITAAYTVAPLKSSAHPDLAQDFIDFVLSEAGQEIIKENGLLPAKSE
jgi:molybdate transport system substrate-binding protein